MTGQEWEEQFKAEHGRVPKREEYQAAKARNFEPEKDPAEQLMKTSQPKATKPVKEPAAKARNHKPMYLIGAVVIAALLGVIVALSMNRDAPTPVTTSSSSHKVSSVSSSSSEKTTSATSSSTVSSSSSATSSTDKTATELTREDRAVIIAYTVMKATKLNSGDITGVTAKIVGGAGSGKGEVDLNRNGDDIEIDYTLSGDGGVGRIAGSYEDQNGEDHAFNINVTDWLGNHSLDQVAATVGHNVTAED